MLLFVLEQVVKRHVQDLLYLVEFIPTHEWQVVQPGQPVPAGLHVRFDFVTGQTQAKLMDDNDNSENYAAVLVQNPKMVNGDFTSSDKKYNSHKMDVKLDTSRTFRPYSELRKDYKEILKIAGSESAVLNKLFTDFEKSKNDKESLLILEEMGDLLRKYDNAVDFAENGKLTILMNRLPLVSSDVKIGILSCLAAALQSNPPVKEKMYTAGLLDKLAQLWHQELLLPKIDSSVIGYSLLATSAFIRNYPSAQKNLFGPRADGDMPAGYNLLKRTLEVAVDDAKIKSRVFALLGDLLQEYNSTGNANDSTNLNQYELIKLADNLPKYGFCQAAVRSLFDPSMWRSNSHRQRTMQAVMLISNVCDQHQLYPSDEAVGRRQIERLLNQWREEFVREHEKEQKDETELDSGFIPSHE
ncbi:unnamed protein product [Hymenolepis diminuta]|uniref:Nucleotide exchange factor SIL1 n=1 Tax=Hymenolepis diminuta TaxID=6216 RepID=A0A158QGE2_HYMDI|nr:unnamed protein product [Hymenolepis diminuta]